MIIWDYRESGDGSTKVSVAGRSRAMESKKAPSRRQEENHSKGRKRLRKENPG